MQSLCGGGGTQKRAGEKLTRRARVIKRFASDAYCVTTEPVASMVSVKAAVLPVCG